MLNIHELAGQVLRDHKNGALCTVVRSEGSTPRHVGSKMLVLPDGSAVGSIGGGDLEHRVLGEARMAMADGKPRLLTYSLSDPARGDPGVCGGQVEVFVEPIVAPAKVVIIGGGHVGKAVVHLAKWLGFRVVVSDDREEYCNPHALPEADEFIVCPINELPGRTGMDSRTSLVLTTRGSSVDVAGLPALLSSDAGYIGVIGSKRRWATTKKELIAAGLEEEQLARIHSPMGLELQAETPEEIAVSIMAEILLWRERATGAAMGGLARRRAQAGQKPES